MDQTPRPRATPPASQGPTLAHTMRFQQVANRIVRALLRVPGLNRLAGRRLLTLSFVGRRTGRRFTVPVAYTRHDGEILVGTPFAWGRNLRTGEPVEILLAGRRLTADVVVVSDEVGVVRDYAIMCRDNTQFAAFNGIGLDTQGRPSSEDLRLAWQNGARVFHLTARPVLADRPASRHTP